MATEALVPILKKVQQLAEADALLLSGLPVTWQFVADGLGLETVPWFSAFKDSATRWRPAYRQGSSRKSARDGLIALAAGKKKRAEAARYLLSQFSGEALVRLRSRVTNAYAGKSTRQPQGWWKRLPVETPNQGVILRFLESRKSAAGINTVGEAQRAVSHLTDSLFARFTRFCVATPEHAQSDEAPTAAVNNKFFTMSGELALSPQVSNSLRMRLPALAATLVTAVELSEQCNPASVAKHIGNHLEAELLHDAHREFGMLQERLFGALVMAGFPLLYWHDLAKGASPTSALPNGRRQEFIEAECAAVYNALYEIFNSTRLRLADPTTTRDANGRKGIISAATQRAGSLAFAHISAMRLLKWVEACEGLLSRPDVKPWLASSSTDAAERECRSFSTGADELTNLFHLILAKNHGLAGAIHTEFIRGHDSFNSSHDSRDVASLVREELVKAISSFDYTTGLRFSTYAMNRVGLELRRRPHQERQLIKLSSDQTTAQPRVWQLAKESDYDESDARFFDDLAERYNKTFAETGRSPLTAHQAADLLRVGRMASVTPSERDEDDGPTLQLADSTPAPVTDAVVQEVAAAVRTILDGFAPAEELAISILLRATPPMEALSRVNCAHLASVQSRISKVFTSRAKQQPLTETGAAQVLITPGQRAEKAIRTKLGEEVSRRERRGGESAGDD